MENISPFQKDPIKQYDAQKSFSKDTSTVINEIKFIQQQIIQSGSFDSEKNELDIIIHNIMQNKIDPSNALKLAQQILSRRQDYH